MMYFQGFLVTSQDTQREEKKKSRLLNFLLTQVEKVARKDEMEMKKNEHSEPGKYIRHFWWVKNLLP